MNADPSKFDMSIDLTPYKTFKEVTSLHDLNRMTQKEDESWDLLAIRTIREPDEDSGGFADKHVYLLGTSTIWRSV